MKVWCPRSWRAYPYHPAKQRDYNIVPYHAQPQAPHHHRHGPDHRVAAGEAPLRGAEHNLLPFENRAVIVHSKVRQQNTCLLTKHDHCCKQSLPSSLLLWQRVLLHFAHHHHKEERWRMVQKPRGSERYRAARLLHTRVSVEYNIPYSQAQRFPQRAAILHK